MFEWPKAKEGDILVPLPFKIFWATSLPLAAIIGLLMWLISEGEKRDWKLHPKASESQPGDKASRSTSSQLASRLKVTSSNVQGNAAVSSRAGTQANESAGKNRTIANDKSRIIPRWFRRGPKSATDIESVHSEPQGDLVVETVLGKQDWPQELPFWVGLLENGRVSEPCARIHKGCRMRRGFLGGLKGENAFWLFSRRRMAINDCCVGICIASKRW